MMLADSLVWKALTRRMFYWPGGTPGCRKPYFGKVFVIILTKTNKHKLSPWFSLIKLTALEVITGLVK